MALVAVLAGLATPAAADPATDPKLTKNSLYSTGAFPRSVCAEKPIKQRNNAAAGRAYITFVVGCLDRIWSKQLAKKGIKFKKPKLKLLAKDPARYCGIKWTNTSDIDYCESSRELMAVLDRTILNLGPDDLWIFTSLSNAYAEHVQYLTGIETAMWKILPEEDEPGFDETNRRVFLQAFCLSGVFTGSVFPSMPRKTSEWNSIVKAHAKFLNGEALGSVKSITYWMNRGFTSRDPKFCNTWIVSNSLVA
ncbi:hypothetical protein [Herbidospora sp. RD11066]